MRGRVGYLAALGRRATMVPAPRPAASPLLAQARDGAAPVETATPVPGLRDGLAQTPGAASAPPPTPTPLRPPAFAARPAPPVALPAAPPAAPPRGQTAPPSARPPAPPAAEPSPGEVTPAVEPPTSSDAPPASWDDPRWLEPVPLPTPSRHPPIAAPEPLAPAATAVPSEQNAVGPASPVTAARVVRPPDDAPPPALEPPRAAPTPVAPAPPLDSTAAPPRPPAPVRLPAPPRLGPPATAEPPPAAAPPGAQAPFPGRQAPRPPVDPAHTVSNRHDRGHNRPAAHAGADTRPHRPPRPSENCAGYFGQPAGRRAPLVRSRPVMTAGAGE